MRSTLPGLCEAVLLLLLCHIAVHVQVYLCEPSSCELLRLCARRVFPHFVTGVVSFSCRESACGHIPFVVMLIVRRVRSASSYVLLEHNNQ